MARTLSQYRNELARRKLRDVRIKALIDDAAVIYKLSSTTHEIIYPEDEAYFKAKLGR